MPILLDTPKTNKMKTIKEIKQRITNIQKQKGYAKKRNNDALYTCAIKQEKLLAWVLGENYKGEILKKSQSFIWAVCKVCKKKYKKHKNAKAGKRVSIGIRGYNTTTCSRKCSKINREKL